VAFSRGFESVMTAGPGTTPCYRTILALDIEASTDRTNPVKGSLRAVMYELLETALRKAGITEGCRDPLVDRGDGVLALIHPLDEVPKTLLLNRVIPMLSKLLGEHSAHDPVRRFRLRAVVHAGEVHYDRQGCFGGSLDVAFRLLDAPAVKHSLLRTAAPIVLVVSSEIYHGVVRHGYEGIDEDRFEQLVRVSVADEQHEGWVHIPADGARNSANGNVVAFRPWPVRAAT
jgi:hypothetical protein